MIKEYYLNGEHVEKPRDIILNGYHCYSPSDAQIEQAGYEIREIKVNNNSSALLTYEDLVVQKIRERYSINDELALLRQRDIKTDEFNEYYAFCEQCKAEAKEKIEQENI